MRKIVLCSLSLIIVAVAMSQDKYEKLPSFGIHYLNNDFETAAELRATSLSDVIRNKQFAKQGRMNSGLAISHLRGVGKHIDIVSTLSGSFVDYDVPTLGKSGTNRYFMEGAATVNFKLLSDRFCISPFLTAGIGGYSFRKSFGAFVPAGAGIQVKVVRDVFLLFNSQYRIPVTERAVYHFYHSIGIAAPLVNRAPDVIPPPPPPVILDRDNDGVMDSVDRCPDIAGIEALQGCPDQDSDGIADIDDRCPDVPGLAKYEGCPIPDTDGDGINDEVDKCPAIKGIARYEGCPIPDTDGDGLNDEEDKCPSRPGPASNMGCPEIAREVIEKINFAARNIFFATGSAKLLPKSFKSLNDVASLLAADESLQLNIDGHTDTTGNAEKNKVLSEDRASAVRAYLAGQGVAESRMTATGYGPEKPVASNKTVAGRAKNRRVELLVRNY